MNGPNDTTAPPGTRPVCRALGGGVLAALLFILTGASAALAHGTIGAVVDRKTSCSFFSYDDGEPMGYVKVSVTAPGLDQPFQSGATDRHGIFCFSPDQAGPWLVTANDGMGHQHKLPVTVSDSKAESPTVTATEGPLVTGRDRTSQVLAGLGIIFGLTGLFGWYRASRPARPAGVHKGAPRQP
ncbi:hypothetical protein [Desulfofustis glycolicus]|uniref:Nickel transport protein n=1 Tax=Desulfofustis glycolicus DSM 9705 TaxID=1121409 RepID=A0A1M5X1M9_9BACT|nr:hypothetical protein [Desulfofustis glycolicus]MCB2215554.1 DUF4198 domain-containing protein [Desulfobulbaceae bacterium]SHH93640.1 hypothetical protein SAMN02745124_02677 [Desulfofustis glycolicus DSM 9705]